MRSILHTALVKTDPDANRLIRAMSVTPQGNRQYLIEDTIQRLKAAGIWAKIDVFWMLAAHDAQAAKLNWKDPATFALTATNSPTFLTDRHYEGNGSSSYLDSGWNLATNGVNYTRDAASISVWSRNTVTVNQNLAGAWGGANGLTFNPSQSSGNFEYRINQAAATNVAIANPVGLNTVVRTGASATQCYHNGASAGTGSVTSTAVVSGNLYLGGLSGISQFNATQMALAAVGGPLTAAEAAALYSIVQAYMTAVGA